MLALASRAWAAEKFGHHLVSALEQFTPFKLVETVCIEIASLGRLQGVVDACVELRLDVPVG